MSNGLTGINNWQNVKFSTLTKQEAAAPHLQVVKKDKGIPAATVYSPDVFQRRSEEKHTLRNFVLGVAAIGTGLYLIAKKGKFKEGSKLKPYFDAYKNKVDNAFSKIKTLISKHKPAETTAQTPKQT